MNSLRRLKVPKQHQPNDPFPIKAASTILLSYLALINCSSFALFALDKYKAQKHQWRIPEKTLHLTALMGGWIGGMLAMKYFRHKTKSEKFRGPWGLAVAGNCVLALGGAVAFRRVPGFQRILVQNLRKFR